MQKSSENQERNSISIYQDELTPGCIFLLGKKIQACFPDLDDDFYSQLTKRIRANKFTDQRLKEAVNNVIDNCIYPRPTIAQFISFDHRIQLYDYNEIKKMTDTNRDAFTDFKWVKGLQKYASVYHIKKYNLK